MASHFHVQIDSGSQGLVRVTLPVANPNLCQAGLRKNWQSFHSMRGEISYDLVIDDDMSFIEGAYRLPGEDWRVFIVSVSTATCAAEPALEWGAVIESGLFATSFSALDGGQ